MGIAESERVAKKQERRIPNDRSFALPLSWYARRGCAKSGSGTEFVNSKAVEPGRLSVGAKNRPIAGCARFAGGVKDYLKAKARNYPGNSVFDTARTS